MRGTPPRVGSHPGQRRRGQLAGQRHRRHAVAQVHRAADPGARQVVVVAGVRRGDLAQLRVDQRAVVALVVVLGDHLPVRRDLVGVPVGEHQRRRVVRRDELGQVAEVARRTAAPRRGPAGAARARTPSPCQTVDRQLDQPVLARLEAGDVAEPAARRSATRRGRRSTRGRDRRSLAGRDVVALGQQLVAAVPAGVREHPHARRSSRTSSAETSPTITARWVTACRRRASRSATRPRQVQLPGEQVPPLPRQHLGGGVGLGRAASAPAPRPAGRLRDRVDGSTWRLAHRVPPCGGSYAARMRSARVTRPGRRTVEVRREEILTDDHRAARPDRAWRRPGSPTSPTALGVSPALVFYHFGTKDDAGRRGVRARRGARPRPARRGRPPAGRPARPAAPGAAAVRPDRRGDRAGGCGSTPGRWRSASRAIRKVLRRLDQRWCAVLREVVDDGRRRRASSRCPDPAAPVARVSALLDGLSVATLVYRSVTRAQLRAAGWRRRVARELGVDPELAAQRRRASSHQPVRPGSPGRSAPGGPAGTP